MRLKGIWGSIIGGGALGGLWRGVFRRFTRIRGAVRIETISSNHITGRVRVCLKTPDMAPCDWSATTSAGPSAWSEASDAEPQQWEPPQVCAFK